jgi:hypothetical protein
MTWAWVLNCGRGVFEIANFEKDSFFNVHTYPGTYKAKINKNSEKVQKGEKIFL